MIHIMRYEAHAMNTQVFGHYRHSVENDKLEKYIRDPELALEGDQAVV